MALLSTDPLDIKLDETGDIYVGSNGPELVGGLEGVAQLVRVAIKLFRGEWFLNAKVGVPWYQRILGQKPEISEVRAALLDEIKGIPGVRDVPSLIVEFDGVSRNLTATWIVRATFDDIEDDVLTAQETTEIGNG